MKAFQLDYKLVPDKLHPEWKLWRLVRQTLSSERQERNIRKVCALEAENLQGALPRRGRRLYSYSGWTAKMCRDLPMRTALSSTPKVHWFAV
jgi:hypothetical protein